MMVESCVHFSTSSIDASLMLSFLNGLQVIWQIFLDGSWSHLCSNRRCWLLL